MLSSGMHSVSFWKRMVVPNFLTEPYEVFIFLLSFWVHVKNKSIVQWWKAQINMNHLQFFIYFWCKFTVLLMPVTLQFESFHKKNSGKVVTLEQNSLWFMRLHLFLNFCFVIFSKVISYESLFESETDFAVTFQ